MGIYTNCFMFYGVFVAQQSYSKLLESKEYNENKLKWQDYIKPLNAQNWLYCIPHTYFDFESLSSMLESSDVQRGHILMSEVKQMQYNRNLREVKMKNPQLEGKDDYRICRVCNTRVSNNRSFAQGLSGDCPGEKPGQAHDFIKNSVTETTSTTASMDPNQLAQDQCDRFFNLEQDDLSILRSMIQLSIPENSVESNPKWFYCEASWSTHDANDSGCILQTKYEIL